MIEKTVIIMRGLPGAGKSTLTKKLESDFGQDAVICSADDYFYFGKDKVPENYKWSADLLGKAHGHCKYTFNTAIENGKELIVVDNTNIVLKEFKDYIIAANDAGYKVHIHSIVGISAEESSKFSIHNVPLASCVRILKKYHQCPNNIVKSDESVEVTNIIHDYMGIRKGVFGNGKFNKKDKEKSR